MKESQVEKPLVGLIRLILFHFADPLLAPQVWLVLAFCYSTGVSTFVFEEANSGSGTAGERGHSCEYLLLSSLEESVSPAKRGGWPCPRLSHSPGVA